MNLQFIKFTDEYIQLIETWESTNELSRFLSHTRPKYLRECDPQAVKHTLFFLIQFDDELIGAIWLEEITDEDAKLGIYIANKEYRGKGIGKEAIKKLADIAFAVMNLKKIYLNVRESNTNAIKCYKRCGFKITETYPKSYFADASYQGAYQMCLHHSDIENF